MTGSGAPTTLERLKALLDAYGASPDRWPTDERAGAEALLKSNSGAQVLAADTQRFDALLDTAPTVAPSPELYGRVLAAFDRIAAQPSVRRVVDRVAGIVWPGAPLWQPSAALAVSLVAGLLLGVVSPLGSTTHIARSDMTVAMDAAPDAGDGL